MNSRIMYTTLSVWNLFGLVSQTILILNNKLQSPFQNIPREYIVYAPPHMAKQKQDDQPELIYSSYVRTQDVTLKTCRRRWMIGRSGEKWSGISMLAARQDDDDIVCYASMHCWNDFWYDTPHLRPNNPRQGLHTFKIEPLNDPVELGEKKKLHGGRVERLFHYDEVPFVHQLLDTQDLMRRCIVRIKELRLALLQLSYLLVHWA